MTRATTSVLVALILVFVLFGGPCLACTAVVVGGVNHNCCHPKKSCQEPPLSGSLADCVIPAVDLAKMEQASAHVFVSVSVLDRTWNSDVQPQQLGADYVPPDPVLHSPPELYLLNSVLTI